MKTSAIGSIALVILVIIIGWLVWANQPSDTAPMESATPSSMMPAPGTEGVEEMVVVQEQSAGVAYASDGFSPATITVAKDTAVTFTNESGSPMWVASAPHPVHTNYPAFDQKASADTYSFTFTEPGTYMYHNHLNPNHKGKVIVE